MYVFRKYSVSIVMFLVLNMTFELFLPSLLKAQMATGPSAPDFIGLTTTGTNGASVNEYTGKFAYSIPVLTVPGAQGEGYSMSLNYNGPGPDEEASWVGYGWSLTPGAITRAKRGFPDEFNGEEVIRIEKKPVTSFTSITFPVSTEIWGTDVIDKTVKLGASVGGSATIQFADQNGISTVFGVNTGLITKGKVNGKLNVGVKAKNSGETSFQASLTAKFKETDSEFGYENKERTLNRFMKAFKATNKLTKKGFKLSNVSMGVPSTFSKHSTLAVSFPINVQLNFAGNFGIETGMLYSQSSTFISLTDEVYKEKSYGYLNSAAGWNDYPGKMDLSVDHKNSLDELDHYLPMPTVLNDEFNVTANGLNGNFRAYVNKAGHYQEPFYSRESLGELDLPGLEISAGGVTPGIGVGFDLSFPTSSLIRNRWPLENKDGTESDETFKLEDEYSFLFSGELSKSNLFYTDDFNRLNDIQSNVANGDKSSRSKRIHSSEGGLVANLEIKDDIGQKDYPWINSSTSSKFNLHAVPQGSRQVAATHIKAFTKEDNDLEVGGKPYKRACISSETFSLRNPSVNNSSITEFEITETGGTRYTFGLPVYSRNQTNLTFSLRDNKNIDDINETDVVHGKKLAHYQVPDLGSLLVEDDDIEESDRSRDNSNFKLYQKFAHIQGEVVREPYAATHLLTSIESNDYVDISNDGPTPDDLGRYVKFNYSKKYGTDEAGDKGWFTYRHPLVGLNYSEGTLADRRDDMGSFSGGEKEICYLDEIKTKTHIAKFFTSPREDGYGVKNLYAASDETTFLHENQLERLDSIKLFELDQYESGGDPIQTTHFEYDYSLCKGYPGNQTGGGKLTLLRVWTESGSVKNEITKPFDFVYEYPNPDDIPDQVLAEYSEIVDDFPEVPDPDPDPDSDPVQNPTYSELEVNRWGIHAPAGSQIEWHNWEDQKYFRANPDYDPAAYQLKQIVKPGGSKVLVQYERDKFRYVQNSEAGIMVSIEEVAPEEDEGEYFLNLNGIAETSQLTSIANDLNNYFEDNKIYFNFLYKLHGDSDLNLDPMNKSQHIDGYAAVDTLEVVGDKIKITLVKTGYNYLLPKDVCKNYAQVNNLLVSRKGDKVSGRDPYLVNKLSAAAIPNLILQSLGQLENLKSSTCNKLSFGQSFLRIPLPEGIDKYGGGIRVKRLLSLDEGIEEGDDMLFGTEYFYEYLDGTCSGVASNEPAEGGNENMLVKPLYRDSYDKANFGEALKILAGKDKEKLEGPIHRAFLPSPGVSYGSVIKQSIAKGHSANGFVASEYYTDKDDPVIFASTELTLKDDNTSGANLAKLISPIKYYEYLATQGFTILKGDKAGKLKKQTSYTGRHKDDSIESVKTSSVTKTYSTALEQSMLIDDFNESNDYLGIKDELYFYGAKVKSEDIYPDLGADVTIMFPGGVPVPTVNAMPWISSVTKAHKTHTTVHLITAPSFLTKVETTGSGKKSFVETTTYDPMTGNALISSTSDGFTGVPFRKSESDEGETTHLKKVSDYNIPAYNYYDELGGKYINDGILLENGEGAYKDVTVVLTELPNKKAKLTVDPATCSFMKNFFPGDLLKIGSGSIYNVESIEPSGISTEQVIKLELAEWYDNPYIGVDNPKIEILRSGRKNMLSTSTGSISYYNESGLPEAKYELQALINQFLAELNAGIPTVTDPESTINLSNSYPGLKTPWPNCVDIVVGSTIEINFTSDIGTFLFGGVRTAIDKNLDGEFVLHRGNIAWDAKNECGPVKVIDLCPLKRNMEDVVAASANSVVDEWEDQWFGETEIPGNDYESGKNGRWRTKNNFVYSQDAYKINEVEHTTQSGILKEFELFQFDVPATSAQEWIQTDSITKYDKNSNTLETKNALEIPTSMAYGYNKMLPIFNSANAELESCLFESFEKINLADTDGDGTTDFIYLDSNTEIDFGLFPIVDDTAHAGKRSLKVNSTGEIPIRPIKVDRSMDSSGLELKMWVKQTGSYVENIEEKFSLEVSYGSTTISSDAKLIAKTGEWSLLSIFLYDEDWISASSSSISTELTPTIKFDWSTVGSTDVFIDDIRISPAESAMTCYVYDNEEFKILAILNDNHFATFYQYNFKGELIRKRVETMKGVKTLSEQYSHLKNPEE